MRPSLALAVLLVGCPSSEGPPDADVAASDAHAGPDAREADDADAIDATADERPESICPRYDAHARECFGEMTGEDFLAECFSLYELCGGSLPAVVRCRLESECAALGACTGMSC